MGLTNLGIFHTVIGVVAIGAALTSLVNFKKINLAATSGKVYLYCTLIASLTALGISKHGGFNPGHVLSLLIVILVSTAAFLFYKKSGNNTARYFENFLLSFSLFLSLLPTVNETLTRLPVDQPLAKDITDPLIGKTLLVILVVFIGGSVYQFLSQRKINKSPSKAI